MLCAAEEELEASDQIRWGELPMPSLQHVPLDTLSTGVSKLGNIAQSIVLYITVHAMRSICVPAEQGISLSRKAAVAAEFCGHLVAAKKGCVLH